MPVPALDAARPLRVNKERLPFQTDGGVGTRANLGLIVLRTDQTVEDEFRYLLPDTGGIALYETRIHNDVVITPETLRATADGIPGGVALFPDVPFSVIGFACTSASLTVGEDEVTRRVQAGLPGVAVTNPVTAVRAALAALGAERIALLTPYLPGINQSLRAALMARGMDIPVMASFNESDDNTVARISPQSLEEAILDIGASQDCDAVFVSCTSLRLARRAAQIEAKLGKPVTSSNHALVWHMLRLAGIADVIPGAGTLFTRGL